MVFATPSGQAKVSATAYVRYPGQFRIDAVGPDGLRIQSFDNGTAWMSDGKAADDVPPVIVRALEASVQRDIIALLLALKDKRLTPRRAADTTVKGTQISTLEVDLNAAGRVSLAFDSATGLLLSQRYGGDGKEPATEESFTDYRTVQGLRVAHQASVRREGQFPVERVVRTFEINVPIEPAFFRKPAGKLHARDGAPPIPTPCLTTH
jgi:hypothetical protein